VCVWFRVQLFTVSFRCCGSDIQSSGVTTIDKDAVCSFLTLIGIRELSHQYATVISEKGLWNIVIGDFNHA